MICRPNIFEIFVLSRINLIILELNLSTLSLAHIIRYEQLHDMITNKHIAILRIYKNKLS